MADVKILNGYDIKDAKALRNKSTTAEGSFVDTKAGTTTYPTTGSNLTSSGSIVIGNASYISANTSLSGITIYGSGAHVNNSYATAVGYSSNAALQSAAFGAISVASASYTVAAGYNATATQQYAVAIGFASNASKGGATAVGAQASAAAQYSTIVGRSAATYNSNSTYAVAVGFSAKAGTGAVALGGANTEATGQNSIALGAYAKATASYAVQIGQGTNGTYGTLQFRDWQLVDGAGKIPEERLPNGIKSATPQFPNLYDINEENVSEQAILYTGTTNDSYTNGRFYRGRVHYGFPRFNCGGVDNEWLDSYNDVMIDQQKFFTKLAEVTKQRIDNDDIENGLIGGDNAEQSIYLNYDADNDYYLLRFDSDSFEKAFNGTPDDITGLSLDDLADYGIYFRNFHKPSDLEGEYEFCDIYYYAPVYIDSYDWNDSPSYINYFQFLYAMNDSDWGARYVIPEMEEWEFVVDGTSYICPIIPKTYEWNGDEYDGVEFRWEWDDNEGKWTQYINGNSNGRSWTTAEMYTTFGIQIDSGEESSVEHIGLTVRGGDQRYWEQFNPIDESKFATAKAVSDLQSALNVDEETKMFKRFQSARDLNTMTQAGQYKVEAIGSTNLPTQASAARYFWLFVTNFANNNTEVRQVLIADKATMTASGGDYSRYAPNIFVRCRYNNVWSSWKPLLTDEVSPWIQGYDKDKKQILVHSSGTNTMSWVEDTGGSSYTEGSGIDITGNVISVDDLDCGTM